MKIRNRCASSTFAESCAALETLRSVYGQIPEEDQRQIESVCDEVLILQGGFPSAGIGHFNHRERRVRLIGSKAVTDHSQRGQIGLIAHELAHACDFAARGTVEEEAAERAANTILQSWGFEAEFRTTQKEHPSRFGLIGLDD